MSDDCNITSNPCTNSSLQFGNPFLHSYQRRTLDIDEQKPSEKADTLRFCLAQHRFLQLDDDANTSFQHDFSLQQKIKDFEVQYSMLLDSKEALNSYAAPALSLTKNFVNDSKKWKCQIDLEKLDKEIPVTTVKKEIPDVEYIKLLKLMKETVPKEANDIRLSYLKNDNDNKVEDVPNFNIFDEKSLVPMGLDKNDAIVVSNDNYFSSFYLRPKVEMLEVKKKNVGLMSLSNSGRSRDIAADRTTNASSYVGSRPGPSSFIGNIPQQNIFHSEMESTHKRVTKKNSRKYPWEIIRDNENEATELQRQNSFKTASQQLAIENSKKFGARQLDHATESLYGNQKRSLGTRRGISSKFTPPVRRNDEKYGESSNSVGHCLSVRSNSGQGDDGPYAEMMLDERMKNIDIKMVELIMNEIMDNGPSVTWDDIAGLDLAKSTIKEIVVWPMLRPDIFTGLRGPPKGLLLFGPPGTGKTMIGKCIASQSHSTFFSISASSLTSKWVGEGEKMVRAMFAVAKYHQPAVIFIDEIDSLLTQRSESEHESSRRIKTEFLVQLDGATSGDDERLLVVGATNRPQELDEAARRRLVKRLYIPLPEIKARQQIIINLLSDQSHTLNSSDIEEICVKADGYSGADMANLCREAALGPIRSLNISDIQHISVDEVRAISRDDFLSALDIIRASVSDDDLHLYEEWNSKFGINPK